MNRRMIAAALACLACTATAAPWTQAGDTVLEVQYYDAQPDRAAAAMEAVMQKYPQGVDALLVTSDDMALAASSASGITTAPPTGKPLSAALTAIMLRWKRLTAAS